MRFPLSVVDTPPPLTPSAEDGGDEREEEGSSTETGEAIVAVSKLNLQPHLSAGPDHYDPNRCVAF